MPFELGVDSVLCGEGEHRVVGVSTRRARSSVPARDPSPMQRTRVSSLLQSLRERTSGVRAAPLQVSLLPESWLPRLYIALALPATLVLCFLTPPMQVPDEGTHLYRAYQVSELDSIGERRGPVSGSVVPKSLHAFVNRWFSLGRGGRTSIDELAQSGHMRLDPESREFTAHQNSVRYPPTVHLPQAIGIAVGRAFDLPVLGLLFCGRIANALCAVALMALAISIAPAGKLSFAMLGLCPMFVFLAGSLSGDPGVVGASAVFAALLMRAGRPASDGRGSFWPLLVAAILAGTGKLVYIINVTAAAFVPAVEGATFWQRNARRILVPAVPIVLLAAWLLLVSDLIVPVGKDRGVDGGQQLQRMLADPIQHLGILLRDLVARAETMRLGAIGFLGLLDTLFRAWFYTAFAALFVLSLAVSGPEPRTAGIGLRAWALLCIAGVLLVNQVVFYVGYTPVGADHVEGLQGRQLLPLVPMSILALASPWSLPPLIRSLASWGILLWLAFVQVETVRLGARSVLHQRLSSAPRCGRPGSSRERCVVAGTCRSMAAVGLI